MKSFGRKSRFVVIERPVAKAAGLKRYNTGMPCINGHMSDRWVLDTKCVECVGLRNNAFRRKNPVLRRAAEKRQRDKDPTKHRIKNNQWRAKTGYHWGKMHPDKRRKAAKATYAINPEPKRTRNRAFHVRRPDVRKILNIKRRARRLDAPGTFSNSDVVEFLHKQRYLCANPFCVTNIRDRYTIDHKTPIIRGGSNWPRNLQLLCSPCNSSKWTKTQSEWLRSLRRKHGVE